MAGEKGGGMEDSDSGLDCPSRLPSETTSPEEEDSSNSRLMPGAPEMANVLNRLVEASVKYRGIPTSSL